MCVLIWPMQSQSVRHKLAKSYYIMLLYTYNPVFNSLENMPCYAIRCYDKEREEKYGVRKKKECWANLFGTLLQRQRQHNENYLQIIILCFSLYILILWGHLFHHSLSLSLSLSLHIFPSLCVSAQCIHTSFVALWCGPNTKKTGKNSELYILLLYWKWQFKCIKYAWNE